MQKSKRANVATVKSGCGQMQPLNHQSILFYLFAKNYSLQFYQLYAILNFK